MSSELSFMTTMSEEDQAKIPRGKHSFIDYNTTQLLLDTHPAARPRIYAYLERGESAGQIVKLTSDHYLDLYIQDIGFAWLSGNTIADIIKPQN